MVLASTDIAIHASVSANFEVFQRTFHDWREELVRWRCALPQERVRQLRGTLAGWNCRNVQFFLLQLPFDQLGPERHRQLSDVPTRFQLPREQVDLVVQAGRDVLRQNKGFQRFLSFASSRHRPLPARTAEEMR
jgi:NTE family protein